MNLFSNNTCVTGAGTAVFTWMMRGGYSCSILYSILVSSNPPLRRGQHSHQPHTSSTPPPLRVLDHPTVVPIPRNQAVLSPKVEDSSHRKQPTLLPKGLGNSLRPDFEVWWSPPSGRPNSPHETSAPSTLGR